MNTPDPAQAEVLSSGLSVQPDGPLSGEVKREGAETQVYFVRAATIGLIKIGMAACAQRRLETLQGSSPDRLELMGIMLCPDGGALEARLHQQFAHLRAHGEWFAPAEELLSFIAQRAREPRPKKRLSLKARRERAELRRGLRRERIRLARGMT